MWYPDGYQRRLQICREEPFLAYTERLASWHPYSRPYAHIPSSTEARSKDGLKQKAGSMSNFYNAQGYYECSSFQLITSLPFIGISLRPHKQQAELISQTHQDKDSLLRAITCSVCPSWWSSRLVTLLCHGSVDDKPLSLNHSCVLLNKIVSGLQL